MVRQGYTGGYARDPPAASTQGKYQAGFSKRDTGDYVAVEIPAGSSNDMLPAEIILDGAFDPSEIVVADSNTTRRVSEAELAAHLRLHKCEKPDCRKEIEGDGYQVEAVLLDPSFQVDTAPTHPRENAVAEATPVAVEAVVSTTAVAGSVADVLIQGQARETQPLR